MSEQVSEGTSNGTNGANGVTHEPAPVSPGSGGRAALRAAGRAAFLAEAKPDAAPEPVEAADADESAEAEVETETEPEATEEAPDEEPEAEPEPLAAKDPDAAKRMDAIQKAEKRSMEKVQAERQRFESERQTFHAERARFEKEWSPRIEAAQRYEELRERAPYDLVSLAEELGVTEEDFEHHAQQFYRRSPKGKADPKNRDAYERANREREHRHKLTATEKRLAEMEKRIEEREKSAQEEKRLAALTSVAQKALSDDTPIMRKRFEAHPEQAQKDFAIAVKYLREETGEEPDPADVIRELEAIEQENARARGFTIPTKAAAKPVATPKTKTATEAKPKPAPQPKGAIARSRDAARAMFIAGKGLSE